MEPLGQGFPIARLQVGDMDFYVIFLPNTIQATDSLFKQFWVQMEVK